MGIPKVMIGETMAEVFESPEEYEKVISERIKKGTMGYRGLFNLEGKVAIVTGATGGLGRPTALGLADFGADIVIVGRNLEKLKQLKDEISALGRKALAVQADVTSSEQVKDMVQKAYDEFGRIDILITYAGVNVPKNAEVYPDEDWKKVIDVNLTGVFFTNREVGKIMIKQKRGKIINISSVRGAFGQPSGNYAAYAATKGGVISLTRQLAAEWAKYNIQVNAIAPTVIITSLSSHIIANPELSRTFKSRILFGRWAYPDDLIGAIIFFASNASDFVTGQVLFIDGGVTVWA